MWLLCCYGGYYVVARVLWIKLCGCYAVVGDAMWLLGCCSQPSLVQVLLMRSNLLF